jgi:hypothetical protein
VLVSSDQEPKEKPPPVSRWRFAFIRNPIDERIAQGGIYKKAWRLN